MAGLHKFIYKIESDCVVNDGGDIAHRLPVYIYTGYCGIKISLGHTDGNDIDSTVYLLDKGEEADLEDFARDCANEADDPELELIAWGLLDPDDIKMDEGDNGWCRVLIEECFAGYSPLRVTDNFADFHAAQAWIEEQDKTDYYCRNGEMGRPNYTIIPA